MAAGSASAAGSTAKRWEFGIRRTAPNTSPAPPLRSGHQTIRHAMQRSAETVRLCGTARAREARTVTLRSQRVGEMKGVDHCVAPERSAIHSSARDSRHHEARNVESKSFGIHEGEGMIEMINLFVRDVLPPFFGVE